jgi:hypothetical protein
MMAKSKTRTKGDKRTAAAVAEPEPVVVAAPAEQPTEVAAPEPQPEGVRARVAAAAAGDTTVYVASGEPLPAKRKGLVVKVHARLQALGSATPQQLADALVAAGEWTSKAVPVVPVRVWLKEFVTLGVAKVAQ